MEPEKIVTEVVGYSVSFTNPNESFTFPEIQKLLDEGFKVKNIFYTPLKLGGDNINAISITVHLYK